MSPSSQTFSRICRPLLFAAAAMAAINVALTAAPARITGELKQWHKVTIELDGPGAQESGGAVNPFTDYRCDVTFTPESGPPSVTVPGYFAADGDAANSGATAGRVWRAHFAPEQTGRWHYRVAFTRGSGVAIEGGGEPVAPLDGAEGDFTVGATDKTGADFRARGRLIWGGGHYLKFAGSGEYFLKAGPDAPETLLAYADFDGTSAHRANVPLHTWAPHGRDWREGDPTWRGGRGKGLIGALNYLAGKGLNAVSFLTYNAGGDGDDVWPFASRDDKFYYDCSKLDQWAIVFEHAQRLGLLLHIKLQENELDDNRVGWERIPQLVPESLDGGALGPERKLYLREMIARFGHLLGVEWNLGEENTQTPPEQQAMAEFIRTLDGARHPIVIHTFPTEQDLVLRPLLGNWSALTGASIQKAWDEVHATTVKWRDLSAAAGKPWVIANDEQGPPKFGVPVDPGYAGSDGVAHAEHGDYTLHDIRRATLWGNLLAGGGGVSYYFGYKMPQGDLNCEDFRSRDRSWDYCRIALTFFRDEAIPFWEMANADERVGNPAHDNSRYAFARRGSIYLVYLPHGGRAELDLRDAPGAFDVAWFDPRHGGRPQAGDVTTVEGGGVVNLGGPPAEASEDWLAIVRRR